MQSVFWNSVFAVLLDHAIDSVFHVGIRQAFFSDSRLSFLFLPHFVSQTIKQPWTLQNVLGAEQIICFVLLFFFLFKSMRARRMLHEAAPLDG